MFKGKTKDNKVRHINSVEGNSLNTEVGKLKISDFEYFVFSPDELTRMLKSDTSQTEIVGSKKATKSEVMM